MNQQSAGQRGSLIAAPHEDHLWMALAFSLLAAVGYTATNVCLRSVTAEDPVWVSCIKAVPTLLMAVPWLATRLLHGQALVARPRDLSILVVSGTVGQLLGNVLFQFSLGVVGLAITVPMTLSTLIFMGAVLGHFLLGDRLTGRKALAGVVLVSAIIVLAQGAESAARDSLLEQLDDSPWRRLLAVAGAGLCGLSYSVLGIAIRYTGRRGTPLPTTLGLVSLVGVLSLGMATWLRLGWEPLWNTPTVSWYGMIGAGVFNAIAFLSFSKALHCGSVFFVNGVNATQTAMAAVLGIWIFGEPQTIWLGLGVTLTVAGLILMSGRGPSPPVEIDSEQQGVEPQRDKIPEPATKQ